MTLTSRARTCVTTGHRRGPGRSRLASLRNALALALALVLACLPAAAGADPADPGDVDFEVWDKDTSPRNGLVRTTEPGTPCVEGGKDSYRHYFAESPLSTFVNPAGPMPVTAPVFANLPATLRATLDVHYETGAKTAFLLGEESHATIANERGTIHFTLPGGDCNTRPVHFDGKSASLADGTWTKVTGTGSYRGITRGASPVPDVVPSPPTFGFSAEMNPGADNQWSLSLGGNLQVLQPQPKVKVEKTYWGSLGLDYVDRVVTVVYRIGNVGAGDAFDARFQSVDIPPFESLLQDPPPPVTVCGGPRDVLVACPKGPPPEARMGDLDACGDPALPASCDSDLLVLRYRLDPVTGPCKAVILKCTFETTLTIGMSDALDLRGTQTDWVKVTAPALPPPL